MAARAELPHAQIAQAYFILQAACRYNLTMTRQAGIRWLRQNNCYPKGKLLIRVRLAELEELCSKHNDWFKNVDRIIELYDFIMPKSPEECSLQSPWCFFRNVIIVGAAVQGHDDEACMESCYRFLLKIVPDEDSSTKRYKNKQEHQKMLVDELSSYNGVKDTHILKSNYTGIYQYLKKDPDSELMTFLKSIRSSLGPEDCFLESSAEQLRDLNKSDSVVELSKECRKLGYNLLMEQFQNDQQPSNEPVNNAGENGAAEGNGAEVPDDGDLHMTGDVADESGEVPDDSNRKKSPTRAQLEKHQPQHDRKKSPTRAESERHQPRHDSPQAQKVDSEPETEPLREQRKRKRSPARGQTSRKFVDPHSEGGKSPRRSSRQYEKVEEFKLKRRSIHRAADEIPDARELANATAARIQEVLAKGCYEKWSETEEEEVYSDHGIEEPIRMEPASPPPPPTYQRPLPEHSRPNHASGNVRRQSLGLAVVPSPYNNNGRPVRRSVGQWQEYEIEELRLGVTKFGVGQWSHILKHGRFLPGRTSVDLKDKYRNMIKKGQFGA